MKQTNITDIPDDLLGLITDKVKTHTLKQTRENRNVDHSGYKDILQRYRDIVKDKRLESKTREGMKRREQIAFYNRMYQEISLNLNEFDEQDWRDFGPSIKEEVDEVIDAHKVDGEILFNAIFQKDRNKIRHTLIEQLKIDYKQQLLLAQTKPRKTKKKHTQTKPRKTKKHQKHMTRKKTQSKKYKKHNRKFHKR